MKIFASVLFLSIAFIIPLCFNELLLLSVSKGGMGWVFGSIFIRVMVIVFTALSLKMLFSQFEKTKKIKGILVFSVALFPGFAIGFISPIYENDYGDFSEEFDLIGIDQVIDNAIPKIDLPTTNKLVVFFSTSCNHCQEASVKLGANIKGGQKLETFAFFPKYEDKMEVFRSNYNGLGYTAAEVANDSLFVAAAGGIFPAFYLLDKDNKTIKYWNGTGINYSMLDYLKTYEP